MLAFCLLMYGTASSHLMILLMVMGVWCQLDGVVVWVVVGRGVAAVGASIIIIIICPCPGTTYHAPPPPPAAGTSPGQVRQQSQAQPPTVINSPPEQSDHQSTSVSALLVDDQTTEEHITTAACGRHGSLWNDTCLNIVSGPAECMAGWGGGGGLE